MTEPERLPDPITALLNRAVDLNELERLQARNQFLRRIDLKLARRTRGHLLLRFGAPLAVAVGFAVVWFLWTPQDGLEYTVEGAARNGDYVHVPHDHPADIVFSDRTQIHAAAGVRLRIDDESRSNGARISLERGKLDVAVTHAERTNWRFEAGPFKVRVTGTRFGLSWDPDQEQIEVTLRDGSVDIDGYVGSGTLSVHAGQRFFGDARKRTMLVTDIGEPPSIPNKETPTPTPTVAPAPSATTTPPPSTVPSIKPPTSFVSPTLSSRKVSWTELVNKGDYRQVVDEATARGTSDCFATCNPSELSALADAARYVNRGELAEQTLLALRARRTSTYGVRTAFLLGRLYESRGNLTSAKTWYETTLREGSGGAFAAEALAGKMRAINGLEGHGAARAVAREYLTRFPTGVHAAAAKKLMETP